MTIRLGLFDAHHIVRAGFRQLMNEQDDIEIVCDGATGREALAGMRGNHLHVCILELPFRDLSGMDVLRIAQVSCPEVAILIFTALPEEQHGAKAIEAGAHGFINKRAGFDKLVSAIRSVAAGQKCLSPALASLLGEAKRREVEKPLHAELSEREFDIFTKLAVGSAIKAVARDLQLSTRTVATYRARLMKKLDCRTNADLTQYSVRNDLTRFGNGDRSLLTPVNTNARSNGATKSGTQACDRVVANVVRR